MTDSFLDVTFAFGAASRSQFPLEGEPEVAFAGRSNAGKSTAINALCNRKRLAFVSKTPGRTQQINFFRLAKGGFLVDLPGYGYAKVEDKLRSSWDRLLGSYIGERRSLRGVFLIMDARRPFTDLDLQLMDWLAQSRRPVHVLLTKSDKLVRQQQNALLKQAEIRLAGMEGEYSVQLFSGLARKGVESARERLLALLASVPEHGNSGEYPRQLAT